MLLESFTKEIFRPECNPSFESVHCFAHLDQNVSEVLPFLNAVLGGFEYIADPPSVTFRAQGKLITVHGRKIAINALKDEAEADKILGWLQREINHAWANRADIAPCTTGMPRPKVLEILKNLPRTNCRDCGEATCMVFAVRMTEGAKDAKDCPALTPMQQGALDDYMGQFHFEGM